MTKKRQVLDPIEDVVVKTDEMNEETSYPRTF